ncbi:hypothetical protein [Nostoc sp. CMAA1605]|nr:hypothetical protein [Nostoc sp. CMAA1605]
MGIGDWGLGTLRQAQCIAGDWGLGTGNFRWKPIQKTLLRR